mmetsp:Transcript_13639/g.17159  ORF Transcript_13639/g.17159 Transcript_13639/m.17159 type:complete len:740 (-) Transcript_13639:36-2255(-)|eukprot:CAMPEP_0172493158 /NCGR_PEP_ID=MMETSP1066-20121228/24513_1 /TAXON_ID=671091 /ORGANISM="Coscinodiscus wailesii, Strain CCMP2513" /LENGTH=739 /DNA_ID=CAMNT_0013263171 /DNA_START=48 /DNA_END=2267 /DNA_ORIENTATION=-
MNLSSGLPLLLLLAQNKFAHGDGSTFGDGLVTTATDVTSHGMISLDVKDMKTALSSGDFSTAKSIYESGKNSQKYDKDGTPTKKRTLQGFSTAATSGKFDLEPAFWFQVWGISGGEYTNFDEYLTYADSFVSSLLQNTNSKTLAAEAAVALNVWMYVAHELYDGLDDCRRTEQGNNPDGLSDNGLGVKAVDEAVAFYIGMDQTSEVGSGDSLFNLALEAEQEFGINSASGAVANRKFIAGYNKYLEVLYPTDRCNAGSGTSEKLHGITSEMISAMSITLMQKLIHAIVSEDSDRIKLYALSIVPQISACKSSVASDLMSKLYTNTYNNSDRTEVIGLLQSAFDCLGFSCADIGAYKSNVIGQCAETPGDAAIVGYKPSSDVHNMAKIDLDIAQMKILARYSAWTPVAQIYEYGKNAIKSQGDTGTTYETLMDLASSKTREAADPFYGYFSTYNSSPNYAHDVIKGAMDGTGRFSSMSDLQRGEQVFKTCQYQVTYMQGIAQLYRAADLCEAKEGTDEIMESYDKGIALLVGSIEGSEEGGAPTSDGMLMYNLANKRCDQFSTCDANGIANIVPKIMEQFKSGQDGGMNGDCGKMEAAANTISHLTLVPALQGVMRYGLKNEAKEANSDHKDMAEGEVFSLSVLPVIDNYDTGAANVIEKSLLIEQGKKPVADGSQAVAAAVGRVSPKFGVTCSDLGSAEGADPCNTDMMSDVPSGSTRYSIVTAAISSCILVLASNVFF